MSSQKGNVKRTRPQKYKNVTAFKNDLHDKTPKIKLINNIQIENVCYRCSNILVWKIKYNKYKPLKAKKKCTKCEQKCVKCAYNIMCIPCARQLNVCAKCGKTEDIAKKSVTKEEQFKIDEEMQKLDKNLSERKHRSFLRYLAQISKKSDDAEVTNDKSEKEDLLAKLESLCIAGDESAIFDLDDGDIIDSE